jgi:hypothetical protein
MALNSILLMRVIVNASLESAVIVDEGRGKGTWVGIALVGSSGGKSRETIHDQCVSCLNLGSCS